MATVKVYEFKKYMIENDVTQRTKRKATAEKIAELECRRIEETGQEVDESRVKDGYLVS